MTPVTAKPRYFSSPRTNSLQPKTITPTRSTRWTDLATWRSSSSKLDSFPKGRWCRPRTNNGSRSTWGSWATRKWRRRNDSRGRGWRPWSPLLLPRERPRFSKGWGFQLLCALAARIHPKPCKALIQYDQAQVKLTLDGKIKLWVRVERVVRDKNLKAKKRIWIWAWPSKAWAHLRPSSHPPSNNAKVNSMLSTRQRSSSLRVSTQTSTSTRKLSLRTSTPKYSFKCATTPTKKTLTACAWLESSLSSFWTLSSGPICLRNWIWC